MFLNSNTIMLRNVFGSEVNGLVNSIAQFLGVISFLELGVGAVVQFALYKPLAEKNQEDVSKIISSANKGFRYLLRMFNISSVKFIFSPFKKLC